MSSKEERYFDILTDFALMQEENEEIDALMQAADRELPPVPDEHKQQIWNRFEKRQKRNRYSSQKVLHMLRITADIAACFIVLLAISLTAAMANNEWVRSNVYRLLMNSGADGTKVEMVVDEEAAFYVPSFWTGNYYPSSIPDGFHTGAMTGNTGTSLEMWDQSQRMLILEENDPHTIAWIDTDGAEMSSTNINGHPAYIFEKMQSPQQYNCTIVIDLEDRYYVISALNIPQAELVEIAGSVRHVVLK